MRPHCFILLTGPAPPAPWQSQPPGGYAPPPPPGYPAFHGPPLPPPPDNQWVSYFHKAGIQAKLFISVSDLPYTNFLRE